MARDDGVPGAVRCAGGALGALAAGALAVEYLPALVAIGQWGRLRALPGGLCRWRGSGLSRRIALTFDDGPDPEGTPRAFDALDELGLRATPFVLGERGLPARGSRPRGVRSGTNVRQTRENMS